MIKSRARATASTAEVSRQDAERAMATVMQHLGIPLTGDLAKTPARAVAALKEMLTATEPDVRVFRFDAPLQDEDVVVQRGIRFSAVCEHHLLPFWGEAAIAYVPHRPSDDETKHCLIGLSKLSRIVRYCSHYRPQVQERLGQEIAGMVMRKGGSPAVYVELRARHGCMTFRGPNQERAETVTSIATGWFALNNGAPAARSGPALLTRALRLLQNPNATPTGACS